MATDDEPVDREVLDRLEQCSTSAIADTKYEVVKTLAPAIEPVHTDCAFAGTARTVGVGSLPAAIHCITAVTGIIGGDRCAIS